MPGEDLEDALGAAEMQSGNNISAVITHLGENITKASEAEEVTNHYRQALNLVTSRNLDCHISVKLTHLGLDLDQELCYSNLKKLVEQAKGSGNRVWIDMEDSRYTDRTIDIFSRVRSDFPNVGLCLQAYLYRTVEDIKSLMRFPSAIRLVKGCYAEPAKVAFPKKREVDENFLKLAMMLIEGAHPTKTPVGIATHDQELAALILMKMNHQGIPKDAIEFQMLYGIRSSDQSRLRKEGYPVRCLISYGSHWFPWYMRRLAERPANVLFVLRNMFEP